VMVGRGEHKHRLLMIAANSSWLPEVMMRRAVKMCTGFVAPSLWSANVIRYYAEELPVLVYHHGVDPAFKPDESGEIPPGRFRAVHLASTHMQRKGTEELIHAWALARQRRAIPKDALLRLVVDGPRGYFNETIGEACRGDIEAAESYQLAQRLDLKLEDMAALYRDHHLVVQPSRAEGFGLCPLEARACGVPIVATLCTGHGSHVLAGDPGVIVVSHGPESEIDDGPGALAPTISEHTIADALGKAYSNYSELFAGAQQAAPTIHEEWNWGSVTSLFLARNKSLLEA